MLYRISSLIDLGKVVLSLSDPSLQNDRLLEVIERRLADPETIGIVRRALAQEVVLDTWLAGRQEERFTPEAISLLEHEVNRLSRPAFGRVFPNRNMSDNWMRAMFHEVLSASALFHAHQLTGNLEADTAEVSAAVRKLEGFMASETEGPVALGIYYLIVSTYQNYNAIHFYGRLNREDFIQGIQHRPWISYSLTEDLLFGQLGGQLEVRIVLGMPCVFLTDAGRRALNRMRRILEEAGEVAWRLQYQHLSLFNELDDYDALFSKFNVNISSRTQQFLDFAGVAPGMSVLDVGCGTGRVSLDEGGVADRVGPTGSLTACDPSPGMLALARQKARQHNSAGVTFLQAPTEALPLADNSFDLVLGALFLHFADAHRSVQELLRVTRPGGKIAVFVYLKNPGNVIPVFSIWLRPILELARAQNRPFRTFGNDPGEVGALFRSAGARDVAESPTTVKIMAQNNRDTIRYLLQGPGPFQEVLEPLPYAERQRLVDQLIQDGESICAASTLEERTGEIYCEFVRATKPLF